MKDLGGIEPPKSFRNAGDSVPYGALEESVKLKIEAHRAVCKRMLFLCIDLHQFPAEQLAQLQLAPGVVMP